MLYQETTTRKAISPPCNLTCFKTTNDRITLAISRQFQTRAKIRSSSVSLSTLPQLTNFQHHGNTYLLQHKSTTSFTKQNLLSTCNNLLYAQGAHGPDVLF
jgi:hypothetical protein